MATDHHAPEIILPEGFDARWEDEMADKGFLNGVIVRSDDGLRYRVYFIDPIRLQQDLAAETETGCPYFTEPGLIVLPEITLRAVETAVERLWREGFFDSLRPVDEEIPHPYQLVKKAQAQVAVALETGDGEPRPFLEAVVMCQWAIESAREIEKSAYIESGDCQLHLGEDGLALRNYNDALAIDPGSVATLMRRGLLTFKSNRQAALQDLRKVASDPGLMLPRYFLAYDAVSTGNFQEGLRLCEEALQIGEPDDVPADDISQLRVALLNWEAFARLHLGEPVESVKAILMRAAELAPLDLVIRRNLDALERSDDQQWTAAAWRVNYAVDPHEALQHIPLGRTA
jgi:tetratricopeptide (TPR) repeat protein